MKFAVHNQAYDSEGKPIELVIPNPDGLADLDVKPKFKLRAVEIPELNFDQMMQKKPKT